MEENKRRQKGYMFNSIPSILLAFFTPLYSTAISIEAYLIKKTFGQKYHDIYHDGIISLHYRIIDGVTDECDRGSDL